MCVSGYVHAHTTLLIILQNPAALFSVSGLASKKPDFFLYPKSIASCTAN